MKVLRHILHETRYTRGNTIEQENGLFLALSTDHYPGNNNCVVLGIKCQMNRKCKNELVT